MSPTMSEPKGSLFQCIIHFYRTNIDTGLKICATDEFIFCKLHIVLSTITYTRLYLKSNYLYVIIDHNFEQDISVWKKTLTERQITPTPSLPNHILSQKTIAVKPLSGEQFYYLLWCTLYQRFDGVLYVCDISELNNLIIWNHHLPCWKRPPLWKDHFSLVSLDRC